MSAHGSDVNEKMLQDGTAEHIAGLGWLLASDWELRRRPEDVFLLDDLEAALIRLNPEIAEDPGRVREVMAKLRAMVIGVRVDGLVAANEEFVQWMCGRRTIQYIGTDQSVQVRLLDFDDVASNVFRATTEATFHVGNERRRYDNVLWVNGLPLVVGEFKSPVKPNLSWLNGANDIHNVYEVRTPEFFVTNVLSFATEGREFHYGAVRQPPETWLNWSVTTDEIMLPGLSSVMRSVELLLTPEMVLDVLRSYTLYTSRRTSAGAVKQKIIPRYQQVEATKAVVARVRDPLKKQGLVWHFMGSGKTFAMAYAAAKLRLQCDLDAPTIVVVLDRLDLIQQTKAEFESVGVAGLKIAHTKVDLRRLLSDDARGVIITTIFRFADAGLLNERGNIVVMADEVHRTQEGRMGLDMREALPNAKFIGFTGTPIATEDHNTWRMFGHPDDPGGVLNHYSMERSIHDGATLPVHVEARLAAFQFDPATVQAAFDEMADEENLDEDQRGKLAAKAAHISSVVRSKERITAICADIVTHFRERLAPLGLKAQIVAHDRATCVAYHDAMSALLEPGEEAAVVMTTVKDDPVEWDRWNLDEDQEAALKDRFRDVNDPLKFVIVTGKFLTGFDAPIEGVIYLDKPLRAHTLLQAATRTNRRWTNPNTGQEKLHGLVVDYVGMGEELAKALQPERTSTEPTTDVTIAALLAELQTSISEATKKFAAINRKKPPFDQVYEAQQILNSIEKRAAFAAEFMRCHGMFEFLWPETKLRPLEEDYRFLAGIYNSIKPTNVADMFLWDRFGAKTIAIVHKHLSDITITSDQFEKVALDVGALEALKDFKLLDDVESLTPKPAPTALEFLSRIEDRIAARAAGSGTHKVWRTLAERLEMLRRNSVETAEASVEFFKSLLALATEVIEAEKADDEGRIDEIIVVDPRRGALSQIFEEFKPEGTPVVIELLVEKVDQIVEPVRGSGWQSSHPGDRSVRQELRKVLRNEGLPHEGELFDRAYQYIAENY